MTAKQECEGLLDGCIGRAEEQLARHGEFHPFGAFLSKDGQVHQAASSGQLLSSTNVATLVATLKTLKAESEVVKAVCVVSLVEVKQPGTDEDVTAIRMALDHEQDYSAHVFFPYQLGTADGDGAEADEKPLRQVTFGEPFATRGVSFVFRGESTHPSGV